MLETTNRMSTEPATNATETPDIKSLSKREFSKRHSISERTCDNWRLQGMPCLLVSARKVLFPVADCDLWVRARFLIARGAIAAKQYEAQ